MRKLPIMQKQLASRAAGYTLVELMVTIAIATVLGTIAISSYITQVRQSRRTDARTAVLDLASREERYMSTNSAYTTTAGNLGYGTPFPQTVGSGFYTLNVTVTAANATTTPVTPASFVVTATVNGSQVKDAQCQTFSVDNTGNQTSTPATTCWSN
jgi:type IV pilus assembly protein PilE